MYLFRLVHPSFWILACLSTGGPRGVQRCPSVYAIREGVLILNLGTIDFIIGSSLYWSRDC